MNQHDHHVRAWRLQCRYYRWLNETRYRPWEC